MRETEYFSFPNSQEFHLSSWGCYPFFLPMLPFFSLAGRRKKFPWKEERATVVFPFKEERRRRRFTIFTFRAELPQENWKQRSLIHFADLRNGFAVKGKLLAFFPHCKIFLRMIFEEAKNCGILLCTIFLIFSPKTFGKSHSNLATPEE